MIASICGKYGQTSVPIINSDTLHTLKQLHNFNLKCPSNKYCDTRLISNIRFASREKNLIKSCRNPLEQGRAVTMLRLAAKCKRGCRVLKGCG